MNSKEKRLSAITTGLKKDFPVVIPYTRIFLRDHWDQVTDQPWWTLDFGNVFDQLKVEEDLQAKLDLDWVECRMCRSREWRKTVEWRSYLDLLSEVSIGLGWEWRIP